MFNLAVYGVVDKMLFYVYTLRVGLAMSLDMNDFVHIDLLYLPRSASGNGFALHCTTELLPIHAAPSVQECPSPARTMHPPSAHPAVPPSTNQCTSAE